MRFAFLLVSCLAVFKGTAQARGDDPPREDHAPKAADGDAPLPKGWPGSTSPGKIEVKSYPAYRSAVARAKGATLGSDNLLFWPLFNHITKNEIAMTAPVVSTYTRDMVADPKAQGDVSMEFLYQSTNQGKTGPGTGSVKVEDHPAGQFVCLGVQGGMDKDRMIDGVKSLRAWLDEHKSEWVEDGPPRRLGYHGPMTPVTQRLWEVQIPVKPQKPGAAQAVKP